MREEVGLPYQSVYKYLLQWCFKMSRLIVEMREYTSEKTAQVLMIDNDLVTSRSEGSERGGGEIKLHRPMVLVRCGKRMRQL